MVTHAEVSDALKSVVKGVRTGLIVSGVLTALIGVFMLVWPEKTALVFTYVLGAYAIIAGIVYFGLSFIGGLSGWARVGHILVGIVFFAAGLTAFLNPAPSAIAFAAVVIIMLGIVWIMEGIAALSALSVSVSKGWTIFYAIVSILGGIALFIAPLWFAPILWLWIAIALIVLGIVQIVRAATLRSSANAPADVLAD